MYAPLYVSFLANYLFCRGQQFFSIEKSGITILELPVLPKNEEGVYKLDSLFFFFHFLESHPQASTAERRFSFHAFIQLSKVFWPFELEGKIAQKLQNRSYVYLFDVISITGIRNECS